MNLYACVPNSDDIKKCKSCGKEHYYITKSHVVIVGNKEDMEYFTGQMPFNVEIFNPSYSDIKQYQDIREMHPEMWRENVYKHRIAKVK